MASVDKKSSCDDLFGTASFGGGGGGGSPSSINVAATAACYAGTGVTTLMATNIVTKTPPGIVATGLAAGLAAAACYISANTE